LKELKEFSGADIDVVTKITFTPLFLTVEDYLAV
jgi:hypothetical protein